MTNFLAYPRLSTPDALSALNTIREVANRNPDELASLWSVTHPRAEATPTGAAVATQDQIGQVRESVARQLAPWLIGRPISRDATIVFDLELGRALHEALRIMPADAAHEGTWSFLSAVVFPDVVWTRFPDLHEDRLLGKRHRNTLRRAWFRYDVVGDLQSNAKHPLGEDEMTGIFERSQLARDRQLVRTVVQIILESQVRNRSEFVRNLMKGITALTGPFLLDGLTPHELLERVEALTETPVLRQDGTSPTRIAPAPPIAMASSSSEGRTQTPERVTRQDRADLVRRFHAEAAALCREIEHALGRPPTGFLRMIGQMGGVDAVRTVVGSKTPSETFGLLWGCGRLDLSLEALVLRPDFQGLFTEALRQQAVDRLAQADYSL